MEFYNSSFPKARKSHKCEYCGKDIKVGESYSSESGKYEGDFFTRKLCMVCYEIMCDYCSKAHEVEFEWWVVDDYLYDTYCDSCQCHRTDVCKIKNPCQCPKIRKHYINGGKLR